MDKKIRVLHLEDSASDAELIGKALKSEDIIFEILVVDTKAKLKEALKDFMYDVILSNYSLSSFHSHEALELLKEAAITVPFILVTDIVTDESAIETMKEGACDYIIKSCLLRLPFAIVNAIEKYRLEIEKLAAQERLLHHYENTPLGYIEWDQNGHALSWSKRTEEILGWSEKEFTSGNKTCFDIIYEKDLAVITSLVKDLFEGVIEKKSTQNRNMHKDGTVIWCEWFNSVLKDKNGKVIAIISMVQDITIYKEAMEKTDRANRLNAFVSQLNQNIVRVKDEDTLFINSCSIALEFGKFKIAWIGLFDLENKKISFAKQMGIRLEDLKYFTDVPLLADGPQDYVLKTGKYFICNDILNNAAMKNWESLALRNGVNSFIILPIRKLGNIIGTFNLYSTEIIFSDSEQISLLMDATDDISFALEIFEKTKKQIKAEELVLNNEKLFRAMIENSADMITLSTREGEMFYKSPSILKIFGYSKEEISQTFTADFIHPADIKSFLGKRGEVLKTPGKSIYQQMRLRHKNGDWIWCEATVTNMLDEPGINALIGNFRDISEKKKTEEQQEFDRNNLNALINNTQDLMWSIGTDFKLITANAPFNKMVEQMSGRTIPMGTDIRLSGFSKEQIINHERLLNKAFTGKTFKEIVYTPLPVDMWSETSFYPIRKNDEVIGAACHFRDITKKKKSEINLLQSEKRLKESQTIAQLGNWEMDYATNIALWSEEHCRIYGVSTKENHQTFEKWLSFIHPDDLAYVKKITSESFNAKTGSEIDFRIVLKDGTVKYIYAKSKVELDENGKMIGLYGIGHDVTAIKEKELQLKKSEAFNRGVLNSLSSNIAVIDHSGNIIAVNKAWKFFANNNGDAMLQHTGEGVNYLKVCEKSAQHGDPIAMEALSGIKKVMADRKFTFNLEYSCHSPQSQHWYSMNVMEFESDEPMVVVVHQNISERKLAEMERIKITYDLTQRNKDLEQFSYIVSHNLRAPVANILGAANILNDNGLGSKQKELLSNGLSESVRLLDDVVKDLNRILEVKREINETKERVVFSKLVDDIKTSIKNQIDEANINISYDFLGVDELLTIKVYLYSIFYNLISNSIKYRRRGIDSFVQIKSSLVKDKIELIFQDNGMGIDLTKKGEQVFGLYKRFHTNIEGKGMGLFMVKAQVEALGGKISIKSEVNIGTEFKIEFDL